MKRINIMCASELLSHMGPDRNEQQAEALRRIAIKAGWGEGLPNDVPDELWIYWIAEAILEVAS